MLSPFYVFCIIQETKGEEYRIVGNDLMCYETGIVQSCVGRMVEMVANLYTLEGGNCYHNGVKCLKR